MTVPLIARLLLDAQHEFARAADAVPEASRDVAPAGLNAPGWIIAHAAVMHEYWISVDARGAADDDGDQWLFDWARRQRQAGDEPVGVSFEDARAALDRVLARTTPLIEALTDQQLEGVPDRIEENGWPAGTTAGYLVARAVAHLFAHAADLNVVVTAAGGRDLGLPGRLTRTFDRG